MPWKVLGDSLTAVLTLVSDDFAINGDNAVLYIGLTTVTRCMK